MRKWQWPLSILFGLRSDEFKHPYRRAKLISEEKIGGNLSGGVIIFPVILVVAFKSCDDYQLSIVAQLLLFNVEEKSGGTGPAILISRMRISASRISIPLSVLESRKARSFLRPVESLALCHHECID